ncbi:uncharacterized protein LOC124937477 [Impatiens glandulifera]|uniref:uncharacterized protein LOC124937477 n=1 Tax=Impatiens glandulifera TaxID=253017 RepID=UPI001FB17C06|nr:uncharacterized protein LOC124937477 [Impatiens glandulifera]
MFYSFHSIKNFNESVAMEFMTRFIMKFMTMIDYIELRVCLINPPSLMILSSKQKKSIQPYLLNMIFLPVIFWVFSVPVIPGDVIIAGSDGLFDNLYSNEITSVAVAVNAIQAGSDPEATAQNIAAFARQSGDDKIDQPHSQQLPKMLLFCVCMIDECNCKS